MRVDHPKSFEELEVWQKAVDFAHAIYQASAKWPSEERFGLTQQVRRAAASVAANIAEGAERHGTKEFLQFLSIAKGSLAETKTFVFLAERLRFLEPALVVSLKEKADEVGRLLSGLSRALNKRLNK